MFKFTKKFQQKEQKQKQQEQEQEKKRIEEIKKIDQKVSDIKKEYSIHFSINKLSEKREKTPEEINNLNEMLDIYIEKQNEFKPSVSLDSTELNQAKNQEVQVPTPSDVKVMDQLKEIQVPTPSGVEVIDQLQKVQDKPLPTPSGLGVTDELAKKVAERRALLDKQDNFNTGNVSYSKEIAEQSLKVKSINQKDIQKQHSQTRKQAVNSDNSVPLNHGLNMTEELARIFAERNKISERNNNDTTEKDKVISSTTNVSPDKQSKLSERAAVEVQVQKNTDNIAASEQTQNSQDNSFLLQQLQVGKQKLKKREATEQTNNLSDWVKSDYLDNLNQKKYFQKATQLLEGLRDYLKEEDFENYEFDLSEKYSTSQLDEQTLQSLKILARSLKGLSKISEQNEDIDEDENKVALTALDKLLQSIQKEIAFLDRSKRASGHEPKIVEMTFKPRR